MKDTLGIILGGGQGQRLFPLTKDRSKPAVPIGGKYRLIDIPVSNCLNSHINKIYILTQFNSASLNRHVSHTYRFDNFHKGFVDILAAEQSMENRGWYQGTADAVRKNLKHVKADPDIKYVLILSGDQIYTIDFRKLLKFHIENQSDITISLIPVIETEASSFGLVKLDEKHIKITDFVEKPQTPELLETLNFKEPIRRHFPNIHPKKQYLASMGIYLFNVDVLIDMLDNDMDDFGKDVIPMAIKTKNVNGYLFNGFWEDVGTIKAFWETHLGFTKTIPNFNFHQAAIFTHSRNLPSSRIYKSIIEDAIICEGSIIYESNIKSSIIGIRSAIHKNTIIKNSIIMGADYYESNETKKKNRLYNRLNIEIGEGTVIENAIIDKNAKIGKNCKIVNKAQLTDFKGKNYFIRDGIVIIPKDMEIPDNTEI